MSGEPNAAAALFGCNTYAYMMSESAESCVARMADIGFQEFELMVHPVHLWPADLSAAQRSSLRGLFERRGLQLTDSQPPEYRYQHRLDRAGDAALYVRLAE